MEGFSPEPPYNAVSKSKGKASMICPFCSGATPATWNVYSTNQDELGRAIQHWNPQLNSSVPAKDGGPAAMVIVTVQWARCQNEACHECIIQITRRVTSQTSPPRVSSETWFALPKHKAPPATDLSLVPDSMRTDFLEAYAILQDSPRMSAVLSRRILADLLKKYDGSNNFSTTARIDRFINNTHHPSRIRENLHHLREIADFGAHTQTDQGAESSRPADVNWEDVVINASPEEAEWTLKVVGDLFDYFVIAPERDKKLREAFDKKIEAAGRKKIEPLKS
jgi:hypothetical protein